MSMETFCAPSVTLPPITPDFRAFPKISRLTRPVIVTEKIDGTNAQVFINDDASQVLAGSRNRWLTVEADNFGFAKWVKDNEEQLKLLGPGRHYGEWWGGGIQRGYGLAEKRFSLFNVSRWFDSRTDVRILPDLIAAPDCCYVVPILGTLPGLDYMVSDILEDLHENGSHAAPGYLKPEGIVLFHTHSGTLFKKTLENDAAGKDNRG